MCLKQRSTSICKRQIYNNQTAYVKGRHIGESVRVIKDILEHADQENLDGILFAAYIEKAFDSGQHNFIFSVFKKVGFGPDFFTVD